MRAADYAQNLARCGLVFEGLLKLALTGLFGLEQPRVLNGDDGLVGEGPKERNCLVGEGAAPMLGKRYGADWRSVAQHGDRDDPAKAELPRHDYGAVRRVRFIACVYDLNDCPVEKRTRCHCCLSRP